MDQTTLIAILITTVIATVVREFVSSMVKSSAEVTRKVASICAKFLIRNPAVLVFVGDLCILIVSFWAISSSLHSNVPATQGFAATLALMSLAVVSSAFHIRSAINRYLARPRE